MCGCSLEYLTYAEFQNDKSSLDKITSTINSLTVVRIFSLATALIIMLLEDNGKVDLHGYRSLIVPDNVQEFVS